MNYSDMQEIVDDMIEEQTLSMLSELIMETINHQTVEEEAPSRTLMKPRKMSDSFDASESEPDYAAYRDYNYSPEYKLIVEEEKMGKSRPKIEENKFEIDESEDLEDDFINHNIGKYSIDTSKMIEKMEDVGVSPYKLRRERSPPRQTDAI